MWDIVFGGYYGMANYGDDLFGIASTLAARRFWPSLRTGIVAPRIGDFGADYVAFRWLPENMYRRLGFTGKLARLITGMHAAKVAERVIFAGGSIFHSDRTSVRDLVVLMKRRESPRVSAIGVSLGPFESKAAEAHTREMLKRFEFVAVRDSDSYAIATSMNLPCPVELAADLAGVLPLVRSTDRKAELQRDTKFLVGFSPCFLEQREEMVVRYCRVFARAMKELSAWKKVGVVVLCLNEHEKIGDRVLSCYVSRELASLGIESDVLSYRELGVLRTWDTIASLDAYVSMRLHGAVTAYLTGVPYLLLEHHVKCCAFLDDVGRPNSERLNRKDLVFGDFRDIFLRVMAGGVTHSVDVMSYATRSAISFTAAPWVAAT